MEETRTFTVDRKTWYRGKGPRLSRLLLADGSMCCLGHVSMQCGAESQDILNVSVPASLSHSIMEKIDYPAFIKVVSGFDKTDVDVTKCVRINDDRTITDEEREAALIKIFAKNKCKLEFIN